MLAVSCRTAWRLWPVSVAAMRHIGRYLRYEAAVLARTRGRDEPYWPLFAVWRGCPGPCRWPLRAVLAVTCRTAWLFWPVPLAVMSRIGGYLRRENGVSGPHRGPLRPALAVICCVAWLVWPVSLAVMNRIGRYLPHGVAVLARVAGRYEPCWPLYAV